MKIKAKVSFSGVLSMGLGEVRECDDKELLEDLLQAGYIEEVTDRSAEETEEKPKSKARRSPKKAG